MMNPIVAGFMISMVMASVSTAASLVCAYVHSALWRSSKYARGGKTEKEKEGARKSRGQGEKRDHHVGKCLLPLSFLHIPYLLSFSCFVPIFSLCRSDSIHTDLG